MTNLIGKQNERERKKVQLIKAKRKNLNKKPERKCSGKQEKVYR